MKGFAKPLPTIVDVATVSLILLKSEKKNHSWQNAQKMMNNPNKFKEEAYNFKGEDIEDLPSENRPTKFIKLGLTACKLSG